MCSPPRLQDKFLVYPARTGLEVRVIFEEASCTQRIGLDTTDDGLLAQRRSIHCGIATIQARSPTKELVIKQGK